MHTFHVLVFNENPVKFLCVLKLCVLNIIVLYYTNAVSTYVHVYNITLALR